MGAGARIFLSGLLLATVVFVSPPNPAFAATYGNARFGYSIRYPENLLVAEREADNGDGRAFHARTGLAKVLVWGAYRAMDYEQTPSGIAREYERHCSGGKVTYQVVKSTLVAFSCITPTRHVIYQKTLISPEVLRTVRFEYPYADRAIWDPVVQQVANSFTVARD